MLKSMGMVSLSAEGDVGMLAVGCSRLTGKSQLGQLNFYQKDPANWNIVDGGASGKMKYNIFGGEFDFVFNGHGLEPGLAYSLICHPGPWRGAGLIVLGSDVIDEAGNVHIAGSVTTGGLPRSGGATGGASLWLVLSTDIDAKGSRLTGWSPGHYLFEHDRLTFDDSTEEEGEPASDQVAIKIRQRGR